ncbi:hypothetical protein [Caminibacter sp.]
MKPLISICLLAIFAFSKILIVNSYDNKDQCGMPQLNGFLSKMYEKYAADDFDICFLNARVSTKDELRQKAENILKNINKYDYIVTFDDAAFKLVGIPASKKGKQIFFSGINIPFSIYEKKYHLNKTLFSGVYEKLHIKEILTTFNKIKPVNKIALFYSKGVGEILKNQILTELKNTEFEKKLIFIECKNINELKQKTKEINNNNEFTLFMPFTMSLKTDHKKTPFYKLKDIYLKNIKKPDISVNLVFTKMGFLGFGGVDFFEMGKSLGEIVLNYPKNPKPQIINAPKAVYFINAKRAKEIDFKLPEWFIKHYAKDIIW